MAETARGIIQPKIVQLSVFLENRVGLLLKVAKQLEAHSVHICALSIIDTADCAVARMIVDNVPAAKKAFEKLGLTCYETALVGVELPLAQGIGVPSILGTLLRGEINIHYVYSLIPRMSGNPVLAIHVDDHDTAVRILQNHDIPLVGQDDIVWEGPAGT